MAAQISGADAIYTLVAVLRNLRKNSVNINDNLIAGRRLNVRVIVADFLRRVLPSGAASLFFLITALVDAGSSSAPAEPTTKTETGLH